MKNGINKKLVLVTQLLEPTTNFYSLNREEMDLASTIDSIALPKRLAIETTCNRSLEIPDPRGIVSQRSSFSIALSSNALPSINPCVTAAKICIAPAFLHTRDAV